MNNLLQPCGLSVIRANINSLCSERGLNLYMYFSLPTFSACISETEYKIKFNLVFNYKSDDKFGEAIINLEFPI